MAASFRRSSEQRARRAVRAVSRLRLLAVCPELVQALVQAEEPEVASPCGAIGWVGGSLEWGSRGRWFESSRPDHEQPLSGDGTERLLLSGRPPAWEATLPAIEAPFTRPLPASASG